LRLEQQFATLGGTTRIRFRVKVLLIVIGAWLLISIPLSFLIARIIRRGASVSEEETLRRRSESKDIHNRAA
jgi:hypothetical protein